MSVRRFKAYPAYKDSGVEWLGDIPAHWMVFRSKRLFRLRNKKATPEDAQLTASQQYGVIPQAEFMATEGRRVVQVVTGADILKHVAANDFVISMRSFQGGIELSRHSGAISSAYVVLVPSREVWHPYFVHLLKSKRYIQALQSTSDLVRDGQALRFENFTQVPLPSVPLVEQGAIAVFLGRETARIDELMAKKQRLIELLREQRTALITRAVTKGLDPSVRTKGSGVEGLGAVPAHWEATRLKFILEAPLKYGANEAAELNDPDLPRYVRITDIDESDRLRLETFKSLPVEVAEEYILREGDLLFARSGATAGKTFLYRESWGVCAYAGYLIRARLDLGRAFPEFVRYFTASSSYWQWLSAAFIQATIQNVSAEKYASLVVPQPPLGEQRAIASFLDLETTRIDALIAKVREAIDRLKELRTALISAAVTGKIDVRDETA